MCGHYFDLVPDPEIVDHVTVKPENVYGDTLFLRTSQILLN
jgi:hypothetical protein